MAKYKFTFRWYRYSLISELAHRLHGQSPQFGKTALQKLVYLLQEVYSVPLGYRFSLYNYGPYCQRLANDLSVSSALKAVRATYSNQSPGGFHITEGSRGEQIRERSRDFLNLHEREITQLMMDFGSKRARELELYTTAIFMVRGIREKGGPPTLDGATKLVHDLKPYFDREEIISAISDLIRRGLIDIQRSPRRVP